MESRSEIYRQSRSVIDDYFLQKSVPPNAIPLKSIEDFENPQFLLYPQLTGLTIVTIEEHCRSDTCISVIKGGMHSISGNAACYGSQYFQAIPSRHHPLPNRFEHLTLDDLATRDIYLIKKE